MKAPTLVRAPWSVSFASVINALSIPLIAFLLWWILDRVTDPGAYCPVLEEFKVTQANLLASWRCQPILLAQLNIAKYVAIGLVGALSLSHLVSVVREAKASFQLSTKLGSIGVGGDGTDPATLGAKHVAQAADDAADEVAAAVEPGAQTPQEGGGPAPKYTPPPGEQL